LLLFLQIFNYYNIILKQDLYTECFVFWLLFFFFLAGGGGYLLLLWTHYLTFFKFFTKTAFGFGSSFNEFSH